MKRIVAVLLAMLLVLMGACALAEEDMEQDVPEEQVGEEFFEETIVSPIHEVESFEALCEAVPGVALIQPSTDATEESYCWIEGGEDFPVIAQIQFNLHGDYYTYRAAFCENEEAVKDIDGVYLPFDHEEVISNVFENDFPFNLRACLEDTYAVIDWFYPVEQTQYSLFSETAGHPEMRIVEVAEQLIPIDGDSEEWALADNE